MLWSRGWNWICMCVYQVQFGACIDMSSTISQGVREEATKIYSIFDAVITTYYVDTLLTGHTSTCQGPTQHKSRDRVKPETLLW